MRILLTGGTGQVGHELRSALEGVGQVTAPARNALDLASADSIAAAVRATIPALIVNAAAYTAVDQAEVEPDLAMAVNGHALQVLAEEALRCGAAVVHYSTDYVFDGHQTGPYAEDDATGPLNAYGLSKLAGEQAIAAAGCPHFIFRTSWIYGPRGRNFLLTLLRLLRERRELRIVADQVGAPTPARFIADATATILRELAPGGKLDSRRFAEASGIYHMTAAGQTSWHGFARAILEGIGSDADVQAITSTENPTPARRPASSVLDNGKLRRRFGVALPDWKVGLRQCLDEVGRQPAAG